MELCYVKFDGGRDDSIDEADGDAVVAKVDELLVGVIVGLNVDGLGLGTGTKARLLLLTLRSLISQPS